jgi:hypothetical protein
MYLGDSDMKTNITRLCVLVAFLSFSLFAADGYRITGNSGIMYFVAIDSSQKDNEDVFRFAVGEVCARRAVCQVQYWIADAPNSFPLSDEQVDLKLVQWQQNQNTGLRRWLVKCNSSTLFQKERECM